MGHDVCCIVSCKNTGRNNKTVKFYKFPTATHKALQKKKWIAAVKKVNTGVSPWNHKSSDAICSAHFINNEKSDEQLHPSYAPTIFQSMHDSSVVNHDTAIERHERFKRRILKHSIMNKVIAKKETPVTSKNTDVPASGMDMEMVASGMEIDVVSNRKSFCDKTCDVNFLTESYRSSDTSVCNRYVYVDATRTTCEVEIQTDIFIIDEPTKIPNRKKYRDVNCSTEQKIFADKMVGPNSQTEEQKTRRFCGFDSIKEDEQLLDLAGVTFENFKFLFKRLNLNLAENSQISKENRLLIFLTKMKTGLTFSALSVIFSVHRTTVANIFYTTLRHLARATANCVYWPEKADIVKTMPECFLEDYSNTRVIIDCTEFRVESPPRVDDRVFIYSHYKKGFTAKVLIGITPSGFISFKSKVAGGRKSDSQITIESGLINLLEDDDVVLADKGFPQFQNVIDESGPKVLLIMPPFLDKNTEFTEEETEETYKVAKCRIHVERVMQRLKTYLILNKITHNLFSYIDDIVHVLCVLVNLQPPIIKTQK